MTSTNKSLARPNAIFLNVILAIIAFILIIYLRNVYVTIIAVVVVVGVYFVFDTKALFKINDDPATPYIESQPMDASVEGTDTGSIVPVIRSLKNVEAEIEETIGCSGINLNSPDIVKIGSYGDFKINRIHAKNPRKTFVLMNDIDCGGVSIEKSVYPEFNASFEGNCFSITNFTITNESAGNNVGFFGKVKATKSSIYIKNVTFADFAFNIDKHSRIIGIFGKIISNTSSKSENDVTLENVTVHLNKPSLITVESQADYFYFGVLSGSCEYSKLLDCNVILSSKIDIYLSSTNLKNLTFGVICGWARFSSIMACSANLIGSDIILNTSDDKVSFGLLCGRTRHNKACYLNLLNNMMILKDASLQTNYTMTNYGYLLGVLSGKPVVTAKNNTVMSFVDGLYFGVDDQLSSSKINVEENNKMNNLVSASPSEISIRDQIYGMQITNNNENNQGPGQGQNPGQGPGQGTENNTKNVSTYWKKVYYIYYEGDTSNMGCRYYDVFNFWKNTELGTYCAEDGMCNANKYGACDSGKDRRGWSQFDGNVSIDCSNNGTITYTLLNDIAFSSYEAVILDDGVTFDGNNNTITFNGNKWYGLFKFTKRDYKINVNVKNINLDLGNSKINSGEGGIVGNSSFSTEDFAEYDINIENCKVDNGKIKSYSGGVVGANFCANSNSTGTITGCSNNCSFNGNKSGGISGYGASLYGKLKIKNCWNQADITNNRTGGICGSNSGRRGQLEIINCWNKGSLANGSENGGILGYDSWTDNTNSYIFVFNCYNTGDLGTTSGGIYATANNNGSRIIILNCYSTCQITDLTNFDNGTNTYGGIVSANNSTFKPYVLYCDVYLTDSAKYRDKTEPNIITRNGYRSVSNINNNKLNSLGSLLVENLHATLFNLVSLKSLISELPYDYISPVWSTDNMSIPGFESNS